MKVNTKKVSVIVMSLVAAVPVILLGGALTTWTGQHGSMTLQPGVPNSQFSISAGMMTMGFCLLVAMMSGSNPPVTNLMPVLNSPLLTLHVAVIMCSYALFFFVAMGGVAGLICGGQKSAAAETLNSQLSTIFCYFPR